MKNYYRPPRPSRASPSTLCQKCLQRDKSTVSKSLPSPIDIPSRHYSYECTVPLQERPYTSRPSRTEQLRNPKLQQKLSTDIPEEFKPKRKDTSDPPKEKQKEPSAKRRVEEDFEEERSSSKRRRRSPSVSTISTNSQSSRSPSPRRRRKRYSSSPPPVRRESRSDAERSRSPRGRRPALPTKVGSHRHHRHLGEGDALEQPSDLQYRDKGRAVLHEEFPPEPRTSRDGKAGGACGEPSGAPSRPVAPSSRSYGVFGRGDSQRGLESNYRDTDRKHREGGLRGTLDSGYQDPRMDPTSGVKWDLDAARAPEFVRQRSLSPYSKRVALTKEMNAGN